MKQTIYILLIGLLTPTLAAQAGDIRLELPAQAGEPIILLYKQGVKEEIIFNGTLDEQGSLTIHSPGSYTGIASLKIGSEMQIDFIINGESPVLRNGAFEHSPENESLQRWFPENVSRKDKLAFTSRLLWLYPESDAFYPALKQEAERLGKEQEEFETMLEASPLYAAKFLKLHSFLNNEVRALGYMDSVQMCSVREYVREKLDIKALFTSGLWFETINGLLAMYDTEMPFHEEFISDMSLLLKRSPNDRVYTTLAENLFEICEAMDWQVQGDQLAYFLLNDQRIVEPQGKLKLLFEMYRLKKGEAAPALTQRSGVADQVRNDKEKILIFYESGCISCQMELENFIINYPSFQNLGYEIISIAADVDKEQYHRLADRFPWKEKYCDYQGMDGPDFQNYGIIATPTIFVIDQEGIIEGRYARLQDLSMFMIE